MRTALARATQSALGLLLALLLVAPVAHAAVVLSDPADDQVVTAGTLVLQPKPFSNVDIRTVEVQESAGSPDLSIRIGFASDVTPSQSVALSFKVEKGPDSVVGSRATGTSYKLLYSDRAATGVPGLHAAAAGPDLFFLVPREAVGASGGDLVSHLTVEAQDGDQGTLPDPVEDDDTTASDAAPDAGNSIPYPVSRPPVRAQAAVIVASAHVTDANGTHTGLAGPQQQARAGPADVSLALQVTNAGTDPDRFDLKADGARIAPPALDLQAGQAGVVRLDAHLEGLEGSSQSIHVEVTSRRGATATLDIQVTFHGSAPVAPREVKPAGLGWLTPVATGIGADAWFGSYAELALLLFFLLLLVAAVFLAMALVRTPWVRVRMTPSLVVATPGSIAEIKIRVDKAKARVKHAKAVLRDAGTWGATLLRRGRSESHRTLQLEPDSSDGILRVRVPPDARPKDRETIELDIVPVDEDGTEHPERARHTRVTVQAGVPTTHVPGAGFVNSRDIRLAAVRHDPPQPRPGSTVVTLATVQNSGEVAAPLRVVLLLDGHPIVEERVEVPPRGERIVTLPWTAGSGKNQVKVQVFLA